MRYTMVAAAALAMTVSTAFAGPLVDDATDDLTTIGVALFINGVYSSTPPIVIGSSVDVSGLSPIGLGGATEEFLAFDPLATLPTVVGLKLELGLTNNGITFSIPYNRALLAGPDRAFDSGANNETGTLVATITSTLGFTLDDVDPTPEGIIVGGTVMFSDVSGTYDNTEGAWVLTLAFTKGVSGAGAATLVLSTDLSIIPTAVSEPAVLGMVGGGLLLLGLGARRRG